MFNWLKEFLDIRAEYFARKREVQICESCETLKQQLAIANQEKASLLNRLLAPPVIEPKVDATDLKPIPTINRLPWRARQQLLEAEDRERAKLLKRQQEESQVANKISTEDLEKELKIAEELRESKTGV